MQKGRWRGILQRCDTSSTSHYLKRVFNLINTVITLSNGWCLLIYLFIYCFHSDFINNFDFTACGKVRVMQPDRTPFPIKHSGEGNTSYLHKPVYTFQLPHSHQHFHWENNFYLLSVNCSTCQGFISGFRYHSVWGPHVNECRNFSHPPSDHFTHFGAKDLGPQWGVNSRDPVLSSACISIHLPNNLLKVISGDFS